MADTNLGRVGFVPRGPYSPGASYEILDTVVYAKNGYCCIKPIPENSDILPTNAEYFVLLVENGGPGSPGPASVGPPGPAFTFADFTPSQLESLRTGIAASQTIIAPVETHIGKITLYGKEYDLYQTLVEITQNIPVIANAAETFTVKDIPVGFNLYLKVDAFIAATDSQTIVADYYNHLYKIQRIFVDTDLATKITIKCLETIPVDVKINLQVQYIKDPGDILELNITVPVGINPANVNLSFPALKYNKSVVAGLSRADGLATYQLLYSPMNKKWCDMGQKNYMYGNNTNDLFPWHPDWAEMGKDNRIITRTAGFYPDKFLQCTDGSTDQIKHRWSHTHEVWLRGLPAIALSDTSPTNCPPEAYNHDWSFSDGLTPLQLETVKARPGFMDTHNVWKEIIEMLDFGMSLGLHDLQSKPIAEGGQLPNNWDDMTQEQFNAEIDAHNYWSEKFFGRKIKCGSLPSGTLLYRRYMLHPIIQFYIEAKKDNDEQYFKPFSDENWIIPKNLINPTENSLLAYRTLCEVFGFGTHGANTSTWKSWVLSQATKPMAEREFCLMGIDWAYSTDNLYTTFSEIDSAIGASATGPNADILWVPSTEEFWEYYYMTHIASVGKSINGQNIKFKIHIPFAEHMYFKSISCMLSGIGSLAGVQVTSSSNCKGTSFGLSPDRLTNETKLLVNLDFNKDLIAKAEKYVSIFESTPAKEYAYDDAYYFVQMLKPGVREPFQSRLNALAAKPEITNLVINNGGSSTTSKDIVIHISADNNPVEMIISTNANFAGASWVPFSSNAPFALPNTPGDYDVAKSIYVQLRNSFGTSDTYPPVSITLVYTVLSLTELKINGTNQPTTSGLVTLSFVYQGTPTHYAIRTDENFTEGDWVAFAENPTIQVPNQSVFEYKTIYAKLKNATTVSPVAGSISSSIMYYDTNSIILNSVTINNGDAETSSNIVNVSWDSTTDPTHYRISETNTFSGNFVALTSQQIAAKVVQVTLSTGIGNKTVYLQLQRNATVSNVPAPDTILVSAPIQMNTNPLINADAASTTDRNVSILLQGIVGTPTHYSIGETSNPASPTWIAFTAGQLANMTISYQLSALVGSSQSKTVYVKVKRRIGTTDLSISAERFDTITLLPAAAPAIKAVISHEYGYANGNMIGITRDAHAGKDANYSSALGWINNTGAGGAGTNSPNTLRNLAGQELAGWKYVYHSSYYPVVSGKAPAGSNWGGEATPALISGNVGPYEDTFLFRGLSTQMMTTASNRSRIVLSLPNGTYSIKIIMSISSNPFDIDNKRTGSKYEVEVVSGIGSGVVVCGPSGFNPENNALFNATLTFEVTNATEGNITLWAWNDTPGGMGYLPTINLIEINKTA